jgi:hypothetical protein
VGPSYLYKYVHDLLESFHFTTVKMILRGTAQTLMERGHKIQPSLKMPEDFLELDVSIYRGGHN